LPQPVEAALFRVAQEGLTNVHRHAGASSARIGLRREHRAAAAPTVVLEIEDGGKGMSAEAAGRPGTPSTGAPGLGLAGMRERLHQFGGYLEIRSDGRGTMVVATVPVTPDGHVTVESNDRLTA
jgi:signal transduction histidine kinase